MPMAVALIGPKLLVDRESQTFAVVFDQRSLVRVGFRKLVSSDQHLEIFINRPEPPTE